MNETNNNPTIVTEVPLTKEQRESFNNSQASSNEIITEVPDFDKKVGEVVLDFEIQDRYVFGDTQNHNQQSQVPGKKTNVRFVKQ